MLQRYIKVGALVVAFGVLAVEAYLLHGYYDRYYDRGTVSDTAASGAAALEEATPPAGSTGPVTTEGTVAQTTGGAEDADSVKLGFEASFVHRATGSNSRGDYTYVSDPRIDGDPNAVVFASPTDSYEHNIGVWYEFADRKKWAIFNQDRAAVPAGAAFEVAVPQASEGFVHRAEFANIVGNSTYLDDPLTNDQPNAVVSVTQNWNPGGGGGVYNDHPVGVLYDEDVNKWTVYNEDGARMPEGAAFNVVVSGDGGPAR